MDYINQIFESAHAISSQSILINICHFVGEIIYSCVQSSSSHGILWSV